MRAPISILYDYGDIAIRQRSLVWEVCERLPNLSWEVVSRFETLAAAELEVERLYHEFRFLK